MKKIILIIVTIFAFGCSKDDGPAPTVEEVEYFSIKIINTCPSEDVPEEFCVTKETYEAEWVAYLDYRESHPGENCVPINFSDIDGVSRSGFWKNRNRYVNHDPCAD